MNNHANMHAYAVHMQDAIEIMSAWLLRFFKIRPFLKPGRGPVDSVVRHGELEVRLDIDMRPRSVR